MYPIAGTEPPGELGQPNGDQPPSRARQFANRVAQAALLVGVPGGASIAAVGGYIATGGALTFAAPQIAAALGGAAAGALLLKTGDLVRDKIFGRKNTAPSEPSPEESPPKDPTTLIKELIQLLPAFSSQVFLSKGFRGRQESKSIPPETIDRFISGLKAVYHFIIGDTNSPPNDHLEELLNRLALLGEALYTKISQLPQEPTLQEEAFQKDLIIVHKNFVDFINALSLIAYYQRPYEEDLIVEMFIGELKLIGQFNRSQIDELSGLFRNTLDQWKERLVIATSYEVMPVFFREFEAVLQGQLRTFEANPYPSLSYLKDNPEFVGCLKEHIRPWYEENVLQPRSTLLAAECSDFCELFKKIELSLEALEQSDPLDSRISKTQFREGLLDPRHKWGKLKTSCEQLLLMFPLESLQLTLDTIESHVNNLSFRADQLLDLQRVLCKHLENQFLIVSKRAHLYPEIEEVIKFICHFLLTDLKKDSSERKWDNFFTNIGKYTDQKDPFKSTKLTIFSWRPLDILTNEIWEFPHSVPKEALAHFLTVQPILPGAVISTLPLHRQSAKMTIKTTTHVQELMTVLEALGKSARFASWLEVYKRPETTVEALPEIEGSEEPMAPEEPLAPSSTLVEQHQVPEEEKPIESSLPELDITITSLSFEAVLAAEEALLAEEEKKFNEFACRLKLLIKKLHQPSFTRWALYFDEKNELDLFLRELWDFTENQQCYDTTEMPQISSGLLKKLLTKIQKIRDDEPTTSSTHKIENLEFILANLSALNLTLEALALYEKNNLRSMSSILNSELAELYALKEIADNVMKEWQQRMESGAFITDNFQLNENFGYNDLLQILLGHLTKGTQSEDLRLSAYDHFSQNASFKEYALICMFQWFVNEFLVDRIFKLEEKCLSFLHPLTNMNDRIRELLKKEPIKAQRLLLEENLTEYQKCVQDARELHQMLSKLHNVQGEEFPIGIHMDEGTTPPYNAVMRALASMEGILSEFERILSKEFNAKGIFEERVHLSFPQQGAPRTLLLEAFNEVMTETKEGCSRWELFLNMIRSCRQDPTKPLEETRLVRVAWQHPHELAEEGKLHNHGWRNYDQRRSPLPDKRLAALAQTVMPRRTIACLECTTKETKRISKILKELQEDQGFQQLLENPQP